MQALTLFLVVMAALSASCKAYYRVCYYTNWAQYRPQGAKFFPEDVDAFLCTHLMYSFAIINISEALKSFGFKFSGGTDCLV